MAESNAAAVDQLSADMREGGRQVLAQLEELRERLDGESDLAAIRAELTELLRSSENAHEEQRQRGAELLRNQAEMLEQGRALLDGVAETKAQVIREGRKAANRAKEERK